MIKEALKNEINRLEKEAQDFYSEIEKLTMKAEFFKSEAYNLEAILELDEKPKRKNGK